MNSDILKELGKVHAEFEDPIVSKVREIVGQDAFVRLITELTGINFYISEKLLNNLKKGYVKTNYNGNNVRNLAVELGLSEKTVNRWIDEKM